jgi:RimJ/RimL family protein N-acetyltransferase
MVEVTRARLADLPLFVQMEQATDTSAFIIPYSYAEHCRKLADPNFVYLSILADGVPVGFFILVLDADGSSVEFRRIVVATKDRGIGQSAIQQMEQFCRTTLGRSRIWLDVFEFNQRGRHIYEKLGYKQCGVGAHDGKRLLLYEKLLFQGRPVLC